MAVPAADVSLTLVDTVLRVRAMPVKTFDKSVGRLLDEMHEMLPGLSGNGLAAPQIGISLQVAVIEYENERYDLVNPVLWGASGPRVEAEEGCLSLPGSRYVVVRQERLVAVWQTRKGHQARAVSHGWLSRIFQHEADHLLGRLIDRFPKAEEIMHPVPPAPVVG